MVGYTGIEPRASLILESWHGPCGLKSCARLWHAQPEGRCLWVAPPSFNGWVEAARFNRVAFSQLGAAMGASLWGPAKGSKRTPLPDPLPFRRGRENAPR